MWRLSKSSKNGAALNSPFFFSKWNWFRKKNDVLRHSAISIKIWDNLIGILSISIVYCRHSLSEIILILSCWHIVPWWHTFSLSKIISSWQNLQSVQKAIQCSVEQIDKLRNYHWRRIGVFIYWSCFLLVCFVIEYSK